MSFEGDYPDFGPKINGDLGLAAAYSADLNTEAETTYNIVEALRVMRPSIIFGLARCSGSQEQFAKLLKLALLAIVFNEMAEALAGDAVDTFQPSRAQEADNAYNLIMLAVAQSINPDSEWQRIGDIVRRLPGKIRGEE